MLTLADVTRSQVRSVRSREVVYAAVLSFGWKMIPVHPLECPDKTERGPACGVFSDFDNFRRLFEPPRCTAGRKPSGTEG